MLVNLEQEVRDILIPIGHTFQSFDFVINPFGDGGSDPLLEVVQDEVPFAEELHGQFLERENIRCESGTDPLPEPCLGIFSGIGPIDFEKLFFE